MNEEKQSEIRAASLLLYGGAVFFFSIAFSAFSLEKKTGWICLLISMGLAAGGFLMGKREKKTDRQQGGQAGGEVNHFAGDSPVFRILILLTVAIVLASAGYLLLSACYPLSDGQEFRPWFRFTVPMISLLIFQVLNLCWIYTLSGILKEGFEKSRMKRFFLWIFGLAMIFVLGFGILQQLFREKIEHDHGDGTVTIEIPVFLDESRFCLYEKENFLIIRYLRDADGPDDTDRSICQSEYLRRQAEKEAALEAEWEAQGDAQRNAERQETEEETALTSPDRAQQEMFLKMEEGYQKIHDTFFQDAVWNRDYDARGNSLYVISENESEILYLKYDRREENDTAARYVLFRNQKNPDGSWNPAEAEILTMYRYDYETEEALDLEQTTW